MNYDETLNSWIEAWNSDKSIPQPYRNAVASSARRLQLESIGARSMTSRLPDELVAAENALQDGCICPLGGKKRECPVHGWQN